MNDRRVHAECKHFQVVRYDRSGHWWLEPKVYGNQRTMLNIHEAAEWALVAKKRKGTIHLGLPGGRSFDRAVRQAEQS